MYVILVAADFNIDQKRKNRDNLKYRSKSAGDSIVAPVNIDIRRHGQRNRLVVIEDYRSGQFRDDRDPA